MELNEKQKKSVEDNHTLIYWYMNKNRLNHEDWYGELAIVLCECVMRYDETKGSFSNLFVKYANWKVYEIRNKQRISVSSWESDGVLTLDLIPDKLAFNSDYIIRNVIDTECDEREKYIISLLEDGKNQSEIGEVLGLAQYQVSRIINRIRGKMEKYGYYR